jgi:hypothetical protein
MRHLTTMLWLLAVAVYLAETPALRADAASADFNRMPLDTPVARPGSFGIGLIAGEPTGLTLKYWFTDRMAMDLGAGWSFAGEDSLQLSGDWLYHVFDLVHVDHGELPFYVGLGGRLKFSDNGDTRVGVRLPIGMAYEFEDVPLELFAEVAPVIDVAPATQLKWNGGIGIRYFFR